MNVTRFDQVRMPDIAKSAVAKQVAKFYWYSEKNFF